MKTLHTSLALVAFVALIAATAALSVNAQNVVLNAPPSDAGTTMVYRQRMPDGSIVYSDKALKGGKVERVLPVIASETPRAAARRERKLASESRFSRDTMQSSGSTGAVDDTSRSGR